MELVMLTVILIAVIVLYITQWLPIEVTSLLILPALFFTGILDYGETVSGFSSSATIAVAAMFVLSAGLTRTGSLEFVTSILRYFARGNVWSVLLVLALTVPVVSAFMNNTPIVVMMVPVLMALSRDLNIKPSKLMIPLSYFSILGGTCTLIGTSTNILVNDLYIRAGGPGFGLFDFAPMGLFYLAGGAMYIILFGHRLLPERSPLSAMMTRERTAKFVTEVQVEADSSLVGMPAGEVFPPKSSVTLLEIVRNEEVILAIAASEIRIEPDDALIIEGTSKDIAQFLTGSQATLASVVEDDHRVPIRTTELLLSEAVVLPDSPFLGRRIGELALNRHYGVKVLAIQRRGRHHRFRIREMRLMAGDVLLLQAETAGLSNLRESEAVLLVEGLEQTVAHRHRRFIALAIMFGVIALASATNIPIAMLAVSGAAMMILTRCLRPDEAFRSLDPSVLLLLAGTIPLGLAMTNTGLASMVVNWIVGILGTSRPVVLVSMFYMITSLATSFLSNGASAVLLAPIALGISLRLGVDPKPFLIAIAFGASASFSTPVGYQTNTIVMGPGGYRFKDYLRIGIPMDLLMWLLATLMIPFFWPFEPL